MNIFYTYILFLSFGIVFSQEKSIDSVFSSKLLSKQEKIKSLDSLINSNSLSKKNKLLYLNKYSRWLYNKKEYSKAINIARKDLNYSRKHFKDSSCLIQEKHYLLSYYLYRSKKPKEAIVLLKNAEIDLNSTCKYSVKCLSTLAICYRVLGEYYKTIEYYQLVLAALKPNTNYKRKINSYINISQAYTSLGGKKNIEKGSD